MQFVWTQFDQFEKLPLDILFDCNFNFKNKYSHSSGILTCPHCHFISSDPKIHFIVQNRFHLFFFRGSKMISANCKDQKQKGFIGMPSPMGTIAVSWTSGIFHVKNVVPLLPVVVVSSSRSSSETGQTSSAGHS